MESSFVKITNSLETHTITNVDLMNNREIPTSLSLPLLNTHRRVLREQMHDLIAEQDRFEIVLDQQFLSPQTYSFSKRIDEWERESIEKIQLRAEQLRRQLTNTVTSHLRRLSNNLQELSNRLLNQRNMDTFVQTDLELWRKTFNSIKTNFYTPSTITIDEYTGNPLVRDTYIALTATNELFPQSGTDKVQILGNGQLAIHRPSIDTTNIQGQNEYNTGCHRIRLCMEQATDRWTFLGICSPSTFLSDQTNSSTSVYGWSSNQFVWSQGHFTPALPSKCIEMQKDDIISLILDCDKSMITMVNERSKVTHELLVDTDHCPLPWQLHVVLHEPNSRVRILSQ